LKTRESFVPTEPINVKKDVPNTMGGGVPLAAKPLGGDRLLLPHLARVIDIQGPEVMRHPGRDLPTPSPTHSDIAGTSGPSEPEASTSSRAKAFARFGPPTPEADWSELAPVDPTNVA
jgi:hypothetical protein